LRDKSVGLSFIAVAVAIAAGTWWAVRRQPPSVEGAVATSRLPRIDPDYSGIVLPPNIAPLNFSIREPGRRFLVRIHSEAGEPIEIASRSPKIAIPLRRWRALLDANRGQDLRLDVYAEVGREWQQYQPIVNHVAEEEIDGHLAFRLIGPVHNLWHDVEIHQRNLMSFEESAILDGKPLARGCVNCHTFARNDPHRMLVAFRSRLGRGTLLVDHGKVEKLDMRMGYAAWHPTGRMAAYSINHLDQFFHIAGPEVRDVIDLDGALAYYRLDARKSKMVPGASNNNRLESYPAWSPDGRYLYFSSAPVLWARGKRDASSELPDRYAEVKYDLRRIRYDIDSDQWGQPETVLSAEKTGLSILLPRISPDGRFLLVCMCRYGCFPVYQPSSDLYMMDLARGTLKKAEEVNSEFSESWHSWSSNSRWIAFSSKRGGGTFTRCYLSYVDQTGRTHKPLIVPQSDPQFYHSLLKTMSVPELLTGRVPSSATALARAVRWGATIQTGSPSGTDEVDDAKSWRHASVDGRSR
jgi:hypothetical protein